jgi:hypothetical protein
LARYQNWAAWSGFSRSSATSVVSNPDINNIRAPHTGKPEEALVHVGHVTQAVLACSQNRDRDGDTMGEGG